MTWSRWDGWCVSRFAPDGTLDRTIEVPFQQVTCPMFGGNDAPPAKVTTLDPLVIDASPVE